MGLLAAACVAAGQPGDDEAAAVRQYVVDCVKSGRTATLMADPAGKTYPVQLASADSEGVAVLRDGARMLLSWKQLKPKDVFYLSKGLLKAGEVESHLLLTRLALRLGLGGEMRRLLEQLIGDSPQDLGRITPLLDEIGAQTAAAEPKAPPPVARPVQPPKKEPADEGSFYDEEFLGPFPSWANLKSDFHAGGDGKADDTKALQAAFDELATAKQVHKVLFIPEGTYRITATLEMTDTREFYVVGEHPDKAVITWDGPKGGAMFHSNAMRDCRWERMTWDGAGKAGMLLNLAWEGKLGNGSTNMQWVDVYFKDAEIGINAGVGGFQVSETAVRRCHFKNLSKMGVTLNTGNALNWWFRHCLFEDCGQGIAGNLGGYYARECFLKGSKDSDFVTNASCTFAVRDNVSIGSNAFLCARGNATHWAHVTMQNNEILCAGGPALQLTLQAPFLMIDNKIAAQKGAAGKGMTTNGVLVGNQYMGCQPCAFTGKVLKVDERRGEFQVRPPRLPGPLPLQRRPVFEVHPGANSAQLQKAIVEAAALTGKRPVVHLPVGGYSIDATVVIPPGTDMQIVGDGFRTRLSAGKGAGPMFEIRGPSRASLRHVTLYGPGRKGIDVIGCDQPGSRFSCEDSISQGNAVASLFVDRLRNTLVTFHESSGGTGIKAPACKVVGADDETPEAAPKAVSKTAAAPSDQRCRVRLFGGTWGASDPVFEVSKGGWLVAMDQWDESPLACHFEGIGKGTFTGQAMRWAVYTDRGAKGSNVRVDDFSGRACFLNLMLTAPEEKHIQIRKDMPERNLLFMCNTSEGAAYYLNEAQAGRSALVSCNGFYGFCKPVPDAGFNKDTEAAWLVEMLSQVRKEHAEPRTGVPENTSVVRLSRLWIINTTTGIHLRP